MEWLSDPIIVAWLVFMDDVPATFKNHLSSNVDVTVYQRTGNLLNLECSPLKLHEILAEWKSEMLKYKGTFVHISSTL